MTAAIYSSGVEVGQVIKLVRVPPAGDQPAQYQFSDFQRSTPLLVMALIFALVVIVVARWRGFAALIGLGFAGFVLVTFMFPALIAGSNPIMVGLIGSRRSCSSPCTPPTASALARRPPWWGHSSD